MHKTDTHLGTDAHVTFFLLSYAILWLRAGLHQSGRGAHADFGAGHFLQQQEGMLSPSHSDLNLGPSSIQ